MTGGTAGAVAEGHAAGAALGATIPRMSTRRDRDLGLFYLAYVAGLVYLVSLPALRTGSPVLMPALIIGLMAYGTYEFTSWSIMRDWHWSMVATDTLWGGTLTAFSAWAGVTITRMIHG